MARVTLSFDNGPDPKVTPVVLDILQRHHVLTTFFVIGEKLAEPDCYALAERAKAAGHWIGNHTFTHKLPLGLDDDPATPNREIGQTQAVIDKLSEADRLFRPFGGGGILDSRVLSYAARDYLLDNAFTCVTWNCVPGDWKEGDGWVETALEEINALDWSLVVLHDIPNACVAKLDTFITALKDAGHELIQAFPPDCVPIKRGQLVRPEALPEPTL
jgi:peptidoglycan-N-acetylglucosamine deacetylase